jgi:hypothetical protein
VTGAAAEGAGEPAFVVVRGIPSAEDIAALVAVLAALPRQARPQQAPGGGQGEAERPEWSARCRMMREPLRRGPGAWRASALPR